MRKAFAWCVVVLGLGFAPALFPLPWWSTVPEPERAFFAQTWVPTAYLVGFNLLGGLVLLWDSRWWRTIALIFCIAQVGIWWRLSGFFEADTSFTQFIPWKAEMLYLSFGHRSAAVALAVFHRDVLMGLFYHVATLALTASALRSLWPKERAKLSEPQKH